MRLVCKCLRVYDDDIKESYIKNKGDIEKVKEETQATLACDCCSHRGCFKVDISFPELIEELETQRIS